MCKDNKRWRMVAEPEANLSKGVRQLNGIYPQYVNRKHGRVGHLFRGRFKGILVQKEAYLLELARYIVLNLVRGGMVKDAEEWSWSSYRATVGLTKKGDFLCNGRPFPRTVPAAQGEGEEPGLEPGPEPEAESSQTKREGGRGEADTTLEGVIRRSIEALQEAFGPPIERILGSGGGLLVVMDRVDEEAGIWLYGEALLLELLGDVRQFAF